VSSREPVREAEGWDDVMVSPAGEPRTWLFVPGSRPERFAKAAESGADEILLDLEDAVAAPEKEQARQAAVGWLSSGGSGWVRVNAVGTPWHEADVAALAGAPGLRGVCVPKAEHPSDLERIGAGVGRPLLALVETAIGVHGAAAIAGCPGVERLAFGSIDFAADIRAAHTPDTLLLARSTLVVASRVAGLPGPVDGVTTDFRSATATRDDAVRAQELGFSGKLCIHPSQLDQVRAGFRPRPEQVSWARRILSAGDAASGALSVDGEMVDRPVIELATRILIEAGDTDV
jgi:citrate lyase subunit beta/citryl-CoA lyase